MSKCGLAPPRQILTIMRKIALLLVLTFCFCVVSAANDDRLVKVEREGMLQEAIGNRINEMDSIWVEGPIDSTDIRTLWSACFHGKLIYINLSMAKVKDHRIPPYAFYNPYEQQQPEYWIPLPLREVVLPDDITEIGRDAFAWSMLERINIPKSLKTFGIYSFYQCQNLAVSPLVIPEGVEMIPGNCFTDCHSLREVVLPSTIKTIDQVAFYNAWITKVNLPEGLDSVGMGAFAGNRIEHLTLPSSCHRYGFDAFSGVRMKRLTFSEGTTRVPQSIACSSSSLEIVDFPSTIEEIEADAFVNCTQLKNPVFPEGLRRIGDAAFRNCSGIDSLAIPASVEYIGHSTFMDMTSLKAISSKSPTPPRCEGFDSGNSFGGGTRFDIPVYVPTGSSDLYHDAIGWNYFFDFIETDDFPASVGGLETGGISVFGRYGTLTISNGTNATGRYAVYAVSGRKVKDGSAVKGAVQVSLPHGVYIIKVGLRQWKIAL